jgi:hypothetical protein
MEDNLKARIEKEIADKNRIAAKASTTASGAAQTQFRLLYDAICRDLAEANSQYGFEKVKSESVSPIGFTLSTDSAQLEVMLQDGREVTVFHKQTRHVERIPMFVTSQGTIHFGPSANQQIPVDQLASSVLETILF